MTAIRSVVFSAYKLSADAVTRLHPADVISKPVRLDQLLQAVERAAGS
jgi:two-component SAPR family response regulator